MMTGATGFLGIHLLPHLLTRHDRIIALGRASPRSAKDRILSALEDIGQPLSVRTRADSALITVEADLTLPGLGLTSSTAQHLSQGLEAIWHSAASTALNGRPATLTATNVEGTRHVLELASAAPSAVVHHISTAFVAGRRRSGLMREDDPLPAAGFENLYEHSKSQAEHLVRDWAQRHHRIAAIYRPSVLVTDRSLAPSTPADPVRGMVTAFRLHRNQDDRVVIRAAGAPDGRINMIPVEQAARLITSLASRQPIEPGRVRASHITHTTDVPFQDVLRLLEVTHPVTFTLVPQKPSDPTPAEYLSYQIMRGYLPYAFHRRSYERASIQTAALDEDDATVIDTDYLLRGLTPAHRQISR
ncbi:SDR family oxidoreductase [Streptomyces sp. ET3-23]|uniref:SDR family oxidoreductase n=1 Tax=Streptomyces sp. ET3-23 TaxID=2885643 RepID=UPI001D11B846|nr:SDR family oxidoreductase [Streptomyces sp. ET3-23]MCC2280902.1 SDR family oxidoreductase [Streptomyces sp. ET3-23]